MSAIAKNGAEIDLETNELEFLNFYLQKFNF